MAASVAANKAKHGPLFPGIVDFMVADVCLMELPPRSYDVVFSNWLLMYLSDDEVAAFARKALGWLSPGGVLFFRESCFRQSGDRARGGFNPTHYRNPRDYFAAFDGAAAYVDGDEEGPLGGGVPGGGGGGGGPGGGGPGGGGGGGRPRRRRRRLGGWRRERRRRQEEKDAPRGLL
jgi:hypothetical protein